MSAFRSPFGLVVSSIGMIFYALQKLFRKTLRCCTLRALFVCNCVVLILNLSFFALNSHHNIDSGWNWWPLETYFLSPLDGKDRDLLDRTFRVFVDALEAANLTYFIYGGTLIGSLRHHGRIPWDDDVDVIVKASDKARLTEVLSQFDPEFALYVSGNDNYASQWKFYPTSGRFVFHRQYRTPYIDIFFYRENETHLWNASPMYIGTEMWSKRSIFPLHRRPFGDLFLPAPCNGLVVIGAHFKLSMCRSREFNHLLEIPLLTKSITIPCDRLAHLYPFVRRASRAASGPARLVQETLMFRNWSIKEVTTHQLC